jgi:hypothetical protein
METTLTSINIKDLKKLDESRLRVAFGQYRETLVLLEYQLRGRKDGAVERRVKELKQQMGLLTDELQRRKTIAPLRLNHGESS